MKVVRTTVLGRPVVEAVADSGNIVEVAVAVMDQRDRQRILNSIRTVTRCPEVYTCHPSKLREAARRLRQVYCF